MEILVVGAGEMGRWFGESMLSAAPDPVEVTFCDSDGEAATDAAAQVGATATTDPSRTYGVVCIAVPIPAATQAIETYSEFAAGAVIDVTGTMEDPVETMREVADDCERCSLHPLFAPANEPGNVPMVVDAGGPVTDTVRESLEARGNDVFETTPQAHDDAMETVQARTHAAILAFGLTAESVPDRFQTTISEELVDLTDQVTAGEGHVYADIQSAFDGAQDIARAAEEIAAADPQRFEQLYEQARPSNWTRTDDEAE